MSRYQPSTPRAIFASIAVAMSVLTVAMMVVLPSQVDWNRATPSPLASTRSAQAPAAIVARSVESPAEAASRFVRIDVVATRGRDVALGQDAPTKL